MKTQLKIRHDGRIICYCGTFIGFLVDIQNVIIPLIDTFVVAVFNDIEFTVGPSDTMETLYEKFERSRKSMHRIVEKS